MSGTGLGPAELEVIAVVLGAPLAAILCVAIARRGTTRVIRHPRLWVGVASVLAFLTYATLAVLKLHAYNMGSEDLGRTDQAIFSVLRGEPLMFSAHEIGRSMSHLWTLRQMSLSVAAMLSRGGELPNTEAAVTKDLGTHFQQELPEIARRVLESVPRGDARRSFRAVVERGVLSAPAYTIQGGTTEILRGIIARGLGLR